MISSDLLVFTACYNEHDNIGLLLDRIVEELPNADILVVDDSSPDGTWDVIIEKSKTYMQIIPVQRPRKLGIGSAHKYALLFAIRENYETLITMDADFSHDPKYLPALLRAHGENIFVTGSRYCEGGSSDYKGYRNIISRLGNIAARLALGVRLRELTTYFRVFDVKSLRRLPLRRVNADGYSYGVQLIYYLRKRGVDLQEVPIHFVDRTRGASKIPRIQILLSAIDLVKLAAKRFKPARDLSRDTFVNDACANCGDRVLAMKHFGSCTGVAKQHEARAYCCTSVGRRIYPPVFTCLRCGMQQVPGSLIPPNLEGLYTSVSDPDYLQNADVRERTFSRLFDQLESSLPRQRGRLLEVGAYCGLFLREAKRRGWQADGVEPSEWAANYAREIIGANVYTGLLTENHDKLQPTYDVVVAWDVLEHVRNPLQFVRDCASYLDSGGLFCFSTLDVDTWFPRVAGQRWPWLMDMHLHYFDRHVIKDLLSRAGLDLIRLESYTHYARVAYALRGVARLLPKWMEEPLNALTHIFPAKLMLPIAFGDIKLYVAEKKSSGARTCPCVGAAVDVLSS
jgi:dolichol-phosphate mannosyltransferase